MFVDDRKRLNTEQKIIGVAYSDGEKVYSKGYPARHHAVLRKIRSQGIDDTGFVKGYVTNHNHFLNCEEALKVVQANGQLTKKPISPVRLYPEDLW